MNISIETGIHTMSPKVQQHNAAQCPAIAAWHLWRPIAAQRVEVAPHIPASTVLARIRFSFSSLARRKGRHRTENHKTKKGPPSSGRKPKKCINMFQSVVPHLHHVGRLGVLWESLCRRNWNSSPNPLQETLKTRKNTAGLHHCLTDSKQGNVWPNQQVPWFEALLSNRNWFVLLFFSTCCHYKGSLQL